MDNQITKPIVDHESSRPYATVSGEALHSWPQDLYLPANALEVVIEAFEGPLDLLLYLIRKQKIDILDIPIAQITHQYVEYVELMQHLHLDLAAEYLVMAAMLAEIKSRSSKVRSRSSVPILWPIRARAVATCMATVDLPAPPFSLPTTMICATDRLFLPSFGRTLAARRKRAAHELGRLEIEEVPDPATLHRQLEATHEPSGLH